MANIIDPLNNAQATVLGSFYSLVATLAFLAINGHHWMLAGLQALVRDRAGSERCPTSRRCSPTSSHTFRQLFAMAFQIAAPVLVTLLLVDVVLGIVSRVVPQMNVFFVGIPLKIGVGLVAVIISLPTFTGFIESAHRRHRLRRGRAHRAEPDERTTAVPMRSRRRSATPPGRR